jgi:hypothetical protein
MCIIFSCYTGAAVVKGRTHNTRVTINIFQIILMLGLWLNIHINAIYSNYRSLSFGRTVADGYERTWKEEAMVYRPVRISSEKRLLASSYPSVCPSEGIITVPNRRFSWNLCCCPLEVLLSNNKCTYSVVPFQPPWMEWENQKHGLALRGTRNVAGAS